MTTPEIPGHGKPDAEKSARPVWRGGWRNLWSRGHKALHPYPTGSIDVITKEDGSIAERRSYDAYGARRNPEWGKPSGAITSRTTRGFTGHEEDDDLGLVNMKGRMMDPRLGRFTTTDPVIANIWDGQTHNRYSYVNGNPLAFVDPTGFEPEDVYKFAESSIFLGGETKTPDGTIVTGSTLLVFKRVDSNAAEAPNHEAAKVSATAPPVDVNTTGNGDDEAVVIPVIETPHAGGPGTDDPFGVYPNDIELGGDESITTFEQLLAGDPAGGRTFFRIHDEPGIGRDLRIIFGPKRETIMLRPQIGGDMRDDVSRAKQDLAFEVILTAATVLTPGPLDDMAAAGLRASARGGANVVRAGQTAEAAVRAIEYIGTKRRYLINGRWRIPDGVREGVLTEIKNVNKLAYTRQLRDYAAIAQQKGWKFHLWVKPTTQLSRKLEEQVASGAIIKRYIP